MAAEPEAAAAAPAGDPSPADRVERRRGIDTMPKMKTDSGARKRIKVTGTGRLRRRKAFRSHLLEKKSSRAQAPPRP